MVGNYVKYHERKERAGIEFERP